MRIGDHLLQSITQTQFRPRGISPSRAIARSAPKTAQRPASQEIASLWHTGPLAHRKWLLLKEQLSQSLSLPPIPQGCRGLPPLTELQALARSTLDSLLVSVSKTFIFSTRHVKAVSVASPTFS